MKKIKKYLLILLLILVVGNYSTLSYAASNQSEDIEIIQTIVVADKTHIKDDLKDLKDYASDGGDVGKLEDKAEIVVGILSVVGTVVSVVALILIGIKYMLGSVEEKADYKKTLGPYLIGAILVFTVSWLPQLIYDIMQNFN